MAHRRAILQEAAGSTALDTVPRAGAEDRRNAFEAAFGRASRASLRRVVADELGSSLRARVDPSDIVQEAQLEALDAAARLRGPAADALRAWLFRTAFQRLSKLRRACPAARRDVGRENEPVGIPVGTQSATMAAGPTPSEQAEARERRSD